MKESIEIGTKYLSTEENTTEGFAVDFHLIQTLSLFSVDRMTTWVPNDLYYFNFYFLQLYMGKLRICKTQGRKEFLI